ncbi:unnamed protein product [Phytophthora lilii]|uniref:Unnamed protein product n=1 Tax=Phytophthora lilii TaxID=2077276 RepID=A0A9W6X7R8_9STRA|nr:unnamed protein product [Phytophthora lilii]
MANLNLSPQMVRELELVIERADDCVTGWTMVSVVRLFEYPTTAGSTELGQVPAVDTHVFPDYTECRPVMEIDDFNVLLLRWYVDPENGTLSHALSCTWYAASEEDHKFAVAIPVAYEPTNLVVH